jgi:hypothetical protein
LPRWPPRRLSRRSWPILQLTSGSGCTICSTLPLKRTRKSHESSRSRSFVSPTRKSCRCVSIITAALPAFFNQTQEIPCTAQVLASITRINEIRVEARRQQQSTKKTRGGMSPIIFQTGYRSPGHTRYDSFVVANDPIEEEEEEEEVAYTPGFTPSAVRAARGPEVAGMPATDTPLWGGSPRAPGHSLLPESLAMTPARSRAMTPSRSAASKW